MIWLVWLAAAVGLAATVEDLWRRRVSNPTTLTALGCGLAAHAALDGWPGVSSSLIGAGIGFAAFFVFFLLGGMGGGDVKLMAGFGAIVGRERILTAAILAALAGGLIALGFVACKALSGLLKKSEGGERTPLRKQFIPYAPAITAGVLLSFLSEEEIWTSVC